MTCVSGVLIGVYFDVFLAAPLVCSAYRCDARIKRA